jgi:DNA modification methylase
MQVLDKERALAVLEPPARAKTKKGMIFLDPYRGKYT